MQELMRLRPGDLIMTQRPAKDDVLLQVEGKHKFWGHVGQYRGKRAICIHRPTSKDETALSDFD
jgi:flagellar motor switch protein FliM